MLIVDAWNWFVAHWQFCFAVGGLVLAICRYGRRTIAAVERFQVENDSQHSAIGTKLDHLHNRTNEQSGSIRDVRERVTRVETHVDNLKEQS